MLSWVAKLQRQKAAATIAEDQAQARAAAIQKDIQFMNYEDMANSLLRAL